MHNIVLSIVLCPLELGNCGMELTGSNDLEEIEQFLAKKTTATTTILEEITTT